MRFTTSAIFALLAAPLTAFAQTTVTGTTATSTVAAGQSTGGANPFNIPNAGLSATAGSTLTLSWDPTTSGTVTLLLKSGSSSDLDTVETIASSISNSGSYTWSVPSSTVRGSDYAVEIVDDSDSSETNYTPLFVIDSTVTVASSSSASGSSSSATSTGSSTSESSSAAAATTGSSSASTTGSSSMTTSTSSSSGSSSTTSGSADSTTSAAASSSTHASKNSGARATAAAGMMGLVAVAAFAL